MANAYDAWESFFYPETLHVDEHGSRQRTLRNMTEDELLALSGPKSHAAVEKATQSTDLVTVEISLRDGPACGERDAYGRS